MPEVFPHSLMCSGCRKTHDGFAENAFLFIVAARKLGWVVPDALENKPIACPDCKGKSP